MAAVEGEKRRRGIEVGMDTVRYDWSNLANLAKNMLD
jgi:hypothetical protein